MRKQFASTEIMLTPEELAQRYKTSERTILRWMKTNPAFPKPIRLSRRAIRFRLSDLEAFERSDD